MRYFRLERQRRDFAVPTPCRIAERRQETRLTRFRPGFD
jgi:hypothetical protein